MPRIRTEVIAYLPTRTEARATKAVRSEHRIPPWRPYRFLSVTAGVSRNSTPASSRVALIRRSAPSEAPVLSALSIVVRESLTAVARLVGDQSRRARAARICSGVIGSAIGNTNLRPRAANRAAAFQHEGSGNWTGLPSNPPEREGRRRALDGYEGSATERRSPNTPPPICFRLPIPKRVR